MEELSTKYNPQQVEEKWFKRWKADGCFSADETADKETYSIVIPPPNVTGILHIGHALNNTIQDILIRWKRMRNFNTLWMPGTDHAGIATQNVVEKKLAKEGKNRHQLGREAFIDEVWKWREEYGSTIINQLGRLGCSCDWDRTRFTMDEGLCKAVREVFVQLFEKGLIYKGKRIINWCPRCETALSDEESEPRESNGKLWHIRYPVKDSDQYIIVATTRPETMLGDTGVAVHPEDERYKDIVGKTVLLPLTDREIPIFADEYVDKEFGTGAVKVTPAHDPNDFEMGQRHNLETIQVMDTKATMNENAPDAYQGMDRYACRKQVVADLEAKGLLEKTDGHKHNVGRCYRCDTVVEPYWSDQWFVKMKPLAEPALKAVEDGEIRIYPERWKKVYLDWMYNIRDWCISRQIWWGHRIPVWYCDDCGAVFAEREDPTACAKCGSKSIRQDEDVLDTWFSSWLWPFSTMGWPDKTPLLEKFYPTDVLVTAPEILFFWVARMIMAGYFCMGEKPFSDVLLHGTVRDDTGRKMSKSLGNSIDPVSIIDDYGSDALRFSLIMITAQGQDVFLSKEKFEMGRNFANKLWNASRLIISKLDKLKSGKIQMEDLPLEDRWITSCFHKTIREVTDALEHFRLNEAAHLIHHFVWHDYCDWYLEVIKTRLADDAEENTRALARIISRDILSGILRLLHPFMPHVTEEINARLRTFYGEDKQTDLLITSEYPVYNPQMESADTIEDFHFIQQVIGAVRNIRGENNVPASAEAVVHVRTDAKNAELLTRHRHYFGFLARVKELEAGSDIKKPAYCGNAVIPDAEIYVLLEGLIDPAAEKNRLEKEISRLSRLLETAEKKLGNKKFIENAPAEIVKKETEKRDNFSKQLEKCREAVKMFT